jgi:arylsulfatase A-like enzyme
VGNIDIAATIASLAGIPNAPFPTQTLMQAVMPDADDSVLLEVGMRAIQSADWPVSRGWVAGIAAGPLLYLQEQRGRQELYNVVRDPSEEHDLAKTDSFANQERVLAERLSRAPLDTGLTKVDNWFVRLSRH